MPAFRTTLDQVARSRAIRACRSAGDPASSSMPWLANWARASAVSTKRRISAFTRSTICVGVPRRVTSENQVAAS